MRLRKYLADLIQNIRSFKRKIIIQLTTDKKEFEYLKIDKVDLKKSWYGSSYGGFYILPELLNEQSIVYSFGIGTDISFDKKCMLKHGCEIYAFDPTPKSINYINSLGLSKKFHFFEFGIATNTGHETFFLPSAQRAVSGSLYQSDVMDSANKITVEVKSLYDITLLLNHNHIDVLKIDIEGAEYDVIETILNNDIKIVQMLVEFHDRMFLSEYPKSKEIVKKIREKGFKLFGISASFEEASFVNNEFLIGRN